jgi:hypothetical protein
MIFDSVNSSLFSESLPARKGQRRATDPLPEVTIMKSQAIAIAVVLAGFAGTVVAGSDQTMSPVYVSADIATCTPPAYDPACENFHRLIRANMSKREIGMLFGASSSYPESLSGGVERAQKHYQALVHDYVAQQGTVHEQIAAK